MEKLCNLILPELWLNKFKKNKVSATFTVDEWCFINAAVAAFIGKSKEYYINKKEKTGAQALSAALWNFLKDKNKISAKQLKDLCYEYEIEFTMRKLFPDAFDMDKLNL